MTNNSRLSLFEVIAFFRLDDSHQEMEDWSKGQEVLLEVGVCCNLFEFCFQQSQFFLSF